jgi:hypothetical protein
MARGLGGSEEAATNPAPERHRQEIGRFGEARSLSYLRASLEPRPLSGISLASKAFDGATSGLLIRAASIAIVEEETAISASRSPIRGERRGGAYRIQEEVP